MSMFDIRNYGIPSKSLLRTFSYFSSSILELFVFKKALNRRFFFIFLLNIIFYLKFVHLELTRAIILNCSVMSIVES